MGHLPGALLQNYELDKAQKSMYHCFMNYEYIGHMSYLLAVDHPKRHMSHGMAA